MNESARSSIEALLDGLVQGDECAWVDLVRQVSPLLLAVVRRTFATYAARASIQEQEDVVADVWKNLLENDRRVLHQCRAKGNFVQTIYVLGHNRSVDLLRRRRPMLDVSFAHVASAEPNDNGDNGETLQSALLAASELPQKQRVLINLFFLQRRSYREIAALTAMPQNSIGPTIARALAKLRKVLQQEDAV